MNKLLNNQTKIVSHIISVLLLIAFSGVFILPNGQIGIILFLLTILVGALGLIGGSIIALALTLLLFFTIGSVFFWMAFTEDLLPQLTISFPYILIWMVILLLLSLTTGRVSLLIKSLENHNKQLQEQIRTLVAVDPMTGFDNKERMFLELELEYNRAKRYDQTFTFLLIKINHLQAFEKLYGEGEMTELLKGFSKSLFRCTRTSDHKYRPEEDIFALLLTNTAIEDVDIVIRKLKKELEVYQLKNKKYITLSFEYGYVGFTKELESYTDIYELAEEQVAAYVS